MSLRNSKQNLNRRPQRKTVVARRMLFALSDAPTIGIVCRLRGAMVIYTGAGRTFKVNSSHAIVWKHLRGSEGQACAYFYYREACDEERAEFQNMELAMLAAQHACEQFEARARSLIDLILRPEYEVPDEAVLPADAVVVHREELRGGVLLLSGDKAAWYVEGSGIDCVGFKQGGGSGPSRWRVADPVLVERVRALAR